MKKLMFALILLILFGCSASMIDNPPDSKQPAPEAAWWDGLTSEEVAKEIEAACMDHFGKAVKSAELGLERKTDLFVLREYHVLMEGYLGYYRVVTRDWIEGEPEREQHPREYVTAIKNKNNEVIWRAE